MYVTVRDSRCTFQYLYVTVRDIKIHSFFAHKEHNAIHSIAWSRTSKILSLVANEFTKEVISRKNLERDRVHRSVI